MFRVLFFSAFVIAVLALVYLTAGFHRFGFIQKLAGEHRIAGWLLAAVPVIVLVAACGISLIVMMICILHLAVFWMVIDFLAWLVSKCRKKKWQFYWQGLAAMAVTVIYLAAGWYFAHHVYETVYTINTEKNLGEEGLRVVMIADAHLGSTFDGAGFAMHMEQIQKTEPDLVVIAGDYVDDDSTRADMETACRALGELETTYGVYYVFGNHDKGYFDERDFSEEDLRAALAENGVTVLEDTYVMPGEKFYLIGRQDRSEYARKEAAELTEGLDSSKYMIMLDHQPNDYAAEAASGADLVLSGHTHGGQMIPIGPVGVMIGANDSVYGMETRDGTDFIVTSGISDWAIPFKTGTIAEYVVIDIR